MANDLDKHSYLTALQERNESLFYKLLLDNIKELLPIVHMPTVSEYCAKYALMFRSLPRALFISLKDKGTFWRHVQTVAAHHACCAVCCSCADLVLSDYSNVHSQTAAALATCSFSGNPGKAAMISLTQVAC